MQEILVSLAKIVHENESGCVRYAVWAQDEHDNESGVPDLVLVEEYVFPVPS